MRPDGSGVRRLTNDPATDYAPALSPDASRVAFLSNRSGAYRIYLMNVDGTGVRALNPKANGTEAGVGWSPDGQSLLFDTTGNPDGAVLLGEGTRWVWVARADGGAPRRLVEGAMPARGPTGRLAFVRQ